MENHHTLALACGGLPHCIGFAKIFRMKDHHTSLALAKTFFQRTTTLLWLWLNLSSRGPPHFFGFG
jgi:hypothetical protein